MTLKVKMKTGVIKTIENVIWSYFYYKGNLVVSVVGRNNIKINLENVDCVGIYDYDK